MNNMFSSQLSDQHVNVLGANKFFEETDGCYKFAGTLIVFQVNDGIPRRFESSVYFSFGRPPGVARQGYQASSISL